MRIGYSVALGRNQRSVLEAEQMADPKTHPENRIGRLGESNMNGLFSVGAKG